MGLGNPHSSSLCILLHPLNPQDKGKGKGRYAKGIGQDEVGYRDGKCGLDE